MAELTPRLLDSLAVIEDSVNAVFDQNRAAEWICAHTKLNNRPFSFKDHEYQERILQSEATEKVVRKCSQVGISEMSVRVSLAYADIMRNGFNQIYTLPTHKFAERFSKTRVDDVVRESKRLNSKLTMDNVDVKRFGSNHIYYTGTFGDNAAISVPADMLWHDETDFSDQEVLEKFTSRVTHSPFKWKFSLSTPTVGGFGIDLLFTNSRRHFNQCKCNHCNWWFIPDYEDHVRIPGYDGQLLDITRYMLAEIDWRNAQLHCPKCGKVPDLSIQNRAWTCENDQDLGFEAEGFQVSPFDAPAIITPSFLVHKSTQYALKRDFINFNLGKPFSDSTSGIQPADFDLMWEMGKRTTMGAYYVGVDMGDSCHVVIIKGVPGVQETVVARFRVSMKVIEEFINQVQTIYRPVAVVFDAMPYTETVYRFQQRWGNVYGAFYTNRMTLETSTVKDRVEDPQKALEDLRQVSINRDQAFDVMMEDIRRGILGVATSNQSIHTTMGSIHADNDWEEFKLQLTEMKRILILSKSAFTSPRYHWQKPPHANDHYHHAFLYARIAGGIVGAAANLQRGGMPPMMGRFGNKGLR